MYMHMCMHMCMSCACACYMLERCSPIRNAHACKAAALGILAHRLELVPRRKRPAVLRRRRERSKRGRRGRRRGGRGGCGGCGGCGLGGGRRGAALQVGCGRLAGPLGRWRRRTAAPLALVLRRLRHLVRVGVRVRVGVGEGRAGLGSGARLGSGLGSGSGLGPG